MKKAYFLLLAFLFAGFSTLPVEAFRGEKDTSPKERLRHHVRRIAKIRSKIEQSPLTEAEKASCLEDIDQHAQWMRETLPTLSQEQFKDLKKTFRDRKEAFKQNCLAKIPAIHQKKVRKLSQKIEKLQSLIARLASQGYNTQTLEQKLLEAQKRLQLFED